MSDWNDATDPTQPVREREEKRAERRRHLLSKGVPRTRVKDMWRVSEPWLEQAQGTAQALSQGSQWLQSS